MSMSRKSRRSKYNNEDMEYLRKYGNNLSSMLSLRPSRLTYMATLSQEISKVNEERRRIKVTYPEFGEDVDVTPKTITLDRQSERNERFRQLHSHVRQFLKIKAENDSDSSLSSKMSKRSFASTIKSRSSARVMGGMKLSMDDVLVAIGSVRLIFDESSEEDYYLHQAKRTEHKLPFIKIVLRKTECELLYEQRSLTVLKNSPESQEVELDNKMYDYLTVGKGKVRRRSESEAQTNDILYKTRDVNTTRKFFTERGTYVSYYEMFDTYEALVGIKQTLPLPSKRSTMLAHTDMISVLAKTGNYYFSAMIVERLLASNNYEKGQRRYRSMNPPQKLDKDIEYRYTVKILFRYVQPIFEIVRKDKVRKAVSDISFCYTNGDIVAVAYGIYSFSAAVVPSTGNVCVWSMKNPQCPERTYSYPVPVVSVEFSPFIPSLLAVGLYDGSVEVRDITNPNDPAVAISQRNALSGCEPIIAIKWIKQSQTGDAAEIDPFLCLSQNGSVTRYRIINSPYLLGFKQMVLERVEGSPEGLAVKESGEIVQMQANRHPQGLSFTMHPLYADIYYLLTDEGCLHKCSINYTHQYLEVWRTHEGAVNTMDFSPWSPKLFLTCGNDWFIRIWVDSIFKPIITLRNRMAPVHCAYWSRTHSTIIVSLNRKSMDIWDIRRNLLQPVSSSRLDSSFNTMARFSKCGTCIAVGNERGNLLMCALNNMPFPPHFQYDELEKALFAAIATFPDLIIELKSVGYFGYPKKGYMKPM